MSEISEGFVSVQDALSVPFDSRVKSYKGAEVVTAADVAAKTAESIIDDYDLEKGSKVHTALVETALRAIYGFVSNAERIEVPVSPPTQDGPSVHILTHNEEDDDSVIVDIMDFSPGGKDREFIDKILKEQGEQ